MQYNHTSKFRVATLVTSLCVLMLSHGALAQSIPIANGSFEDPIVADGTYVRSTPGWAWTGADGDGALPVIINPGGPSSNEPWATSTPPGMDGSNFCQLFAYAYNGTGVLWQDTGVQYQAGQTYILTADFGLTTYQTLAPGCQMLLADSSLSDIAGTTISASNLVSGAFTPQSVTYTATGYETGDGTYSLPGDILVGFYMPYSPAQSYLDFDNVQLTAVPEPGSIAFVALGGFGLIAFLRRRRARTAGLFASCCVLLLAQHAGAQSIPILNGSFEYPSVPDGTYYNGTPGWGWSGTSGDGAINVIVNPGGPSSAEPWSSTTPPGMDGSNFCQLFCFASNGTGVLYQDTGIQYQAGKTYILTADFGLPTYQTLAPGCQMLLADSQLAPFASTTISSENLVSQAFTQQSVTYTATGQETTGDGTYGKPGDILIGFWLPYAPPQTYLDFDNVQLTAVPEPGSIGMMALGGFGILGGFLRRRKGMQGMQGDARCRGCRMQDVGARWVASHGRGVVKTDRDLW